MKTSFVILAAAAVASAQTSSASIPAVSAEPGSVALGATCSSDAQCSGGAKCYAVNSGLIPVCGNFQAECTSDSQCAYNTCVSGFCSGMKPSGASSSVATPTPSAAAGSLPLGAECSSDAQCSNGANCYAVNSMLIPRCGNFQATCKNDSQCAYNTCDGGFCSGMKPSNTVSSGAASTAPSTATIVSSVSAAPSSLPLGAQCSSDAQCSNGAKCYATNSMLIPQCGNFQASCSNDSQCAYNTCNGGFCSGLKPSASSGAATRSTGSQTSASQTSASKTTSTTPAAYTGGAAAASEFVSGVAAMAFAAAAMAL